MTHVERVTRDALLHGTTNPNCMPFHQTDSAGYGHRIKCSNVNRSPHVWAYIAVKGEVPPGHTCHTEAVERGECAGGSTCPHRACYNPAHLEAVTHKTNCVTGNPEAKGRPEVSHCKQTG